MGLRDWLFQRKASKRLEWAKGFGNAKEVGSCSVCALPCFGMKAGGVYGGDAEVLAKYVSYKGTLCPECGVLVCGECAFKAGRKAKRNENICPHCSNSLQ